MSGSESKDDGETRTSAAASATAVAQSRLARAAGLARRRIPAQWPLPLSAVVLLAIGFLMFGANTNSSALALSTDRKSVV